jgi:RHS repeat-associated protein
MTDDSGNSLGEIKYLPFGETRSGSVPTDVQFTGQRHDGTGLYYYNARYYDPTIGRFISPDTIISNPANPQSFNRYSYCLNNPLKYIDPSGHIVAFSPSGDPSNPSYYMTILQNARILKEAWDTLASLEPKLANFLINSPQTILIAFGIPQFMGVDLNGECVPADDYGDGIGHIIIRIHNKFKFSDYLIPLIAHEAFHAVIANKMFNSYPREFYWDRQIISWARYTI